jgi:UDP-GlcNAc:undecaprenyl-phosphate GlcNAc-1-phosphate transferase
MPALPPWTAFAAAAFAAALVLLLAPPLRRLAWRSGFLDQPQARKVHVRATPLLGGVAVAAGAFAGCGAALAHEGLRLDGAAPWWISGAIVSLLVGLVDDRSGMGPWPKLLLQAAAGGVFLAGGVYPTAGVGPVWGAVLSLLWIVAVMNAVNFLDNMDGIVGGLAAIAGTGLGLLLASRGRPAEALFALALAGASAGFLRFNFPPASIFLGDAGSLFLGYSLAGLALLAAGAGADIRTPLAVAVLLGYPLFDLCFVVTTRLREGRGIHVPGKDHTTHRLRTLLGTPRRTALAVYAWALALAASGLAAARSHGAAGALLWLGFWALVLIALGWRLARVPVAIVPEPPAAPAPAPPAETRD